MALIDKEIAAGIPAHRIVLMGFSQGGALSLYTAVKYPGRLAGALSLSGWFPCPSEVSGSEATLAKDTPIQMLHGQVDPLVLLEWGRDAMKHVKDLGYTSVKMLSYPGLRHSVSHKVCRWWSC